MDARAEPATILVVDDEMLIRWSLGQQFAAAGYRVVEAEDGRAAMDRFRDGVDLVLLDVRLPDADGRDLLARFRREVPGCKVALMTANDIADLDGAASRLGALAVLRKPFAFEHALRLVREALGR